MFFKSPDKKDMARMGEYKMFAGAILLLFAAVWYFSRIEFAVALVGAIIFIKGLMLYYIR